MGILLFHLLTQMLIRKPASSAYKFDRIPSLDFRICLEIRPSVREEFRTVKLVTVPECSEIAICTVHQQLSAIGLTRLCETLDNICKRNLDNVIGTSHELVDFFGVRLHQVRILEKLLHSKDFTISPVKWCVCCPKSGGLVSCLCPDVLVWVSTECLEYD